MQTKRTIIIAITILLAVVALFFLYLIYQEKQVNNQQNKKIKILEEQKPTTKNYPGDLTGKIYLTLKEKDSNKQGIYYFDIFKKELAEIYTSKECEIIGGNLNSIGNKMTYSSNCGQEDRDYRQIFLLDLATQKKEVLYEKRVDIEKDADFILDEIKKTNFSQNETISSFKFSPNHDGYMIAKKINYNEDKADLVLYDIENKGIYPIFNLSKYESDQILINGWK